MLSLPKCQVIRWQRPSAWSIVTHGWKFLQCESNHSPSLDLVNTRTSITYYVQLRFSTSWPWNISHLTKVEENWPSKITFQKAESIEEWNSLGGYNGGILSRGILSQGGFCPGGFCPRDFVRGDFVLEPHDAYYTKISLVLMAYFSKYRAFFELARKPSISRNLSKTVDVKIGGNFKYFGSFWMFYVWPGCSTLYTSRKFLIGAKISKYR